MPSCKCPDGFSGDLCQVVELGPCEGEPCGPGVCFGDRASPSGYKCSCDPRYGPSDTGTCVPLPQPPDDGTTTMEPTCSDGEMNGQESDVDCGSVDLVQQGMCPLCDVGQGCDSESNCAKGLVCRERLGTCGPGVQHTGLWVEVEKLVVQGVSVGQFMEVLVDLFMASLRVRLRCEDVAVNRVLTAGALVARRTEQQREASTGVSLRSASA